MELDYDVSDRDKDEVDLAQLNMLQILHAESPEESFLSSNGSGYDMHKALLVGEAVDREAAASQGEESDTTLSLQEEESERKIAVTVPEEERQREDLQPEVKASDIGSCTHCEVYTVTFGGVYTYSGTASTKKDSHESFVENNDSKIEQRGQVESTRREPSPSQQKELLVDSVVHKDDFMESRPTADTTAPFEMYTMRFEGVHAYSVTPASTPTEDIHKGSDRSIEYKGQTDGYTANGENLSLLKQEKDSGTELEQPVTCASNPLPDSEVVSTNYEVYNASFRGLHSFTATPSLEEKPMKSQKEVNDQQNQIDVHDSTIERLSPLQQQEMSEADSEDNRDGDYKQSTPVLEHQPDNEISNTHCEVYAARFGGVHTFYSTQSSKVDDFDSDEKLEDEAGAGTEEQSQDIVGDGARELSSSCEEGEDSERGATASKENGTKDADTERNALSTPYEVFNMRFGGLQSFTVKSPPKLNDGGINAIESGELATQTTQIDSSELSTEGQVKSQSTPELPSIQSLDEREEPLLSSDHGEMNAHKTALDVVSNTDKRGSQTVSAHLEVYTVTFGGIHTFSATPSLSKDNPHLKVHPV